MERKFTILSRVGEKIKEARVSKNMSSKQLAKKLGVAESYITDIELGRKIVNEGMINRISKLLAINLNDVSMVAADEDLMEERKPVRLSSPSSIGAKGTKEKSESEEIWNQAFGSMLKNVPIYDYTFTKAKGSRKLPIEANKIEGYASDKVFYLEIEEEDMIGYRISKGDLALAYSVKELEGGSIYLLEYNNKRVIRQVKKLDSSKVLLLSNGGTVKTETAGLKEIQPLARLIKLEIKL